MSVRTLNRTAGLNRRQIELRLLLLSLTIVLFGAILTLFGKLSSTYPIGPQSVNVNTAGASTLSQALEIDPPTAAAVVRYRNSLPERQFASTFRLRRAPALKDIAIVWNWQLLYARSPGQAASTCAGWLIALSIVVIGIHFVLRRFAATADPFILPIVTVLSGIGLMIAISVHDPLRDTFAFSNQAAGVTVFGPMALILPLTNRFRRLPLHRYTYAYAVLAVILLVTLFVFGRGPAETHIQLFGFEPIEVIKVLLVFFIAAYLADRRMSHEIKPRKANYLPHWRDILPLIAIYVFALSLFGAVKDLGPAVLLFGSFVGLLYLVTGQRIYPFIGLVLLLIAGFIGDKLGVGFLATRVEMWLHPWNNTNRLGGQLAQGLWGLSTGGILGSGLGRGGASFVTRAGSDMAFTSIGEELGLVGALCVLLLFVVIIVRGFSIARLALDDFDRLLAAGLTILIGLQAFVITGGATGLMPLTGITVPFVSYGTSSLVANFFCVGILLHLSAKSAGTSDKLSAPPLFLHSSKRIVLALSAGLLILVGVVRLCWLQGIDDNVIAGRSLRIPDADRVYRLHRNPRLVSYASTISRGSIRDRNGIVLAENAPVGEGVSFLTGGVPRIYPLGRSAASLVLATEQPQSELNPLGSDEKLRGYRSLDDLLSMYRRKDLPFPPSPKGEDVILTVDIGLQKVAQRALDSAATRYGNGRGAAVVLNARTGALLAAVTSPTFDPNTLTAESWDALHTFDDPSQPLLNRAFAGVYVPGSVFKLVTATAAFEQHKADLVFNCNHVLPRLSWHFDFRTLIRRNITDDKEFPPHGVTDLAKAIRVSCNVYFAQLGVALGAESLEAVIQQYQLHECPALQSLGSDLPDCAYGQGTILVTPYQMAAVSQTIANMGRSSPPTFFVTDDTVTPGRRILSPEDAGQLSTMMAAVVQNGTAAGAFPGLSVAGKTGSAQLATGEPHSWFVGFAPAAEPTVAFSCVVEHGGEGRSAAASVCRAIVRSALR
jgi:cell division protein FtsW (lipid II flippase)